jgi:hypothetical protein
MCEMQLLHVIHPHSQGRGCYEGADALKTGRNV